MQQPGFAIARAAPAGDATQINALYQKFAAAVRSKDLGSIMSLYVHDGSLFAFDVSPPREYVGWTAYRADWRQLFDSFRGPIKFAIIDLGITASGDVAYTHSLQRVAGKSVYGKGVHLVIRVTDVLRKIGGRWQIVKEYVSVPVEADTGYADWDSK